LIRLRVAQVSALRRCLCNLCESNIRDCRIHIENRSGRRLLDGIEGLKSSVLLA
jgi:transposase